MGLQRKHTLAHEIGHAYYSLRHTDKPTSVLDGLDSLWTEDNFNFMNSGNLYRDEIYETTTTHNISDFIVRKYQWKKLILIINYGSANYLLFFINKLCFI